MILFGFIFYILFSKNIKADPLHSYDNKIQVSFPTTGYAILNEKIEGFIEEKVCEFENAIFPKNNTDYYLIVKYTFSNYKDIISYAFFTEYYVGGAHPNHEIWTINYDAKSDTIVTLHELLMYNPEILNIFSKESYRQLSNNKLFQNPDVKNMLIEGTKPEKENYKNFTFSESGFLIYFERYQIAPYYYGDYRLTIPYKLVKT